jgi:hypothetical protein
MDRNIQHALKTKHWPGVLIPLQVGIHQIALKRTSFLIQVNMNSVVLMTKVVHMKVARVVKMDTINFFIIESFFNHLLQETSDFFSHNFLGSYRHFIYINKKF